MAADLDRARRRYEKSVAKLIRRGDQIQLADLRRINAAFADFSRRAVAELHAAQGFALTHAIQSSFLAEVAEEIDRLARDLGGIIDDGFSAQAQLARQLRVAFGEAFVPDQLEAVLGISQTARAIDAAQGFTAELVAIREGGLGSQMLAQVNGIVRRAALGVAGETAFNAVSQIQLALQGHNLGRWRFAAERIYRTETLRLHSMLTEQTLRDFNTRVPTSRRWVWSGISRREHARIDGQTVAASARFVVPIKEGGSVRLRFPRDPAGPASAVINCGCYLVPIPTAATG